MIIEIIDHSLVINYTPGELAFSEISQLKYYGFMEDSEGTRFLYNGYDPMEMLLKLTTYFSEKRNKEYSLGPYASVLLKEHGNHVGYFSNIRNRAKQIKEGIIDKEEYDTFVSSIRQHIVRPLKDHQLKAAFHLYSVHNGGNFSVPGSGKTSVVISLFQKLRNENVVNQLFVVGPPSSFTAWKREFSATLGIIPRIYIALGGDKHLRTEKYYDFDDIPEMILTSFQSFSNDSDDINKYFSNKSVSPLFVVDEAHYIKQLEGKWATAILCASKYATRRYVLTGTPCPRNYTDLFNIFDFLWSGNLVLTKNEKLIVSESEKRRDFDSARKILHEKLNPFFVRIRKKDLHLTEQIFHEPIILHMNPLERIIYDSVFEKIANLPTEFVDSNIETILSLKRARIMRLRQAVSYPKMLSSVLDISEHSLCRIDLSNLIEKIVNYDDFEVPGKIQRLLLLLKEHENKKVVIWSNFIKSIELIEKHLKQDNIKCDHITGSTPIEDSSYSDELTREDIIDEFLNMDSSIDVLIANPAACAESISLHKSCHIAVYYDLSYNCAQFLQSLDRIHRVGGSETVFSEYYFLQYENTIEQDIILNLKQKKEKMYRLVEENEDVFLLGIESLYDSMEVEAYDRIFKNRHE
ncbi:MAG: DEAD/DEAH box helicase [Candidatus Izemoplasmatales bacterium]|nr:DEAD/DEAH box helicase [Candidatus Izemoplasmatales bacterium]